MEKMETASMLYDHEKLVLSLCLDRNISKPLPIYPEPGVRKAHWDHVREEMHWLAGDYFRERKWRQKTARKFAFESEKMLGENDTKIKSHGESFQKNLASGISKEILLYWKKIQKVVEWRQKNFAEMKHKKKLDKQLDILLSQTEKYSMLLSGKLEEISNSSHLENSLSIPFKFSREDYLEKKKKNDRKNSLDYEIELRDHFKFSPALFVPFLLKHSLRKYQEVGLQWMVSCYENSMNGILADEMGLGKTIQTISLLAYLACKHGSWGPHLIIVPTSVMLNWEVEFKKWCPAFKILTYFGSQKERKLKRRGWSKSNNFHICITTYRLVVQDQIIFRRKKWGYMILDEAHLIKNWRSQRWQTLLHFNSNRRLLLTGTPLQNNLMELWSLMHFLMPNLFQSHAEFKSWFSNPLMEMVDEGDLIDQSVISRLHDVLRPFILRRLKKDVEKNLPEKKEHIISCQLSRRQRRLYEEYISSSDTTTILDSGNLLGVINCLMQLRKVCNHPDLFAGRTIISSFDLLSCLTLRVPLLICSFIKIYCKRKEYLCTFGHFEYFYTEQHSHVYKFENSKSIHLKSAAEKFVNSDNYRNKSPVKARTSNGTLLSHVIKESQLSISSEILHIKSYYHAKAASVNSSSIMQRIHWVEGNLYTFYCVIPRVRATTPKIITGTRIFSDFELSEYLSDNLSHLMESFRYITVRQQLFFHDRKLLQYDCGKLQKLAHLLRALRVGGHKVLIFTQMTKMLDILESFLNLYGYTYCRLDGNTKPEQRQLLVQRFNTDKKLFAFILSTRSGGFGINLTGADTVIFYDTDWNPAIDSQAQDRCHRIGQKKEVHIYRLICDGTVEENIMKKAMRKRELDRVAIQSALFHSFNCNKKNVVSSKDFQYGLSGEGSELKTNKQTKYRISVMGEDLNLIDTYAMSLFEYDYENFRGKYPEEDQSNILESNSIPAEKINSTQELKEVRDDEVVRDDEEILDDIQLCVKNWDQQKALNIYQQH